MINTVTKYYFNEQEAGYIVTYVNSNIQQAVPLDESNTDYQAIQEWLEIEGNTITDNGGAN
jgi:hypothetical protein